MDDSPIEQSLEPIAPILDGSDLLALLEDAADRLGQLAQAEAPTGLTEPDEGGMERWEAGQVWAHIAEFVPYWRGQIKSVIDGYDGTPVPFGRLKTDADRLAGIEMGRTTPVADEAAQTAEAIDAVRRYLDGLTPTDWSAVGMHPVRGEMNVAAMVETFLINHLEEHVAQLDGLRA